MARQFAHISGYPGPHGENKGDEIPDCTISNFTISRNKHLLLAFLSTSAGLCAGFLLASRTEVGMAILVLCTIAFLGGLLSTWSPCGYSSLSLLRPDQPYGPASVARWIPTLCAHGMGYLSAGLILAIPLGLAAWLLPTAGLSGWTLAVLGSIGLAYGLRQLGLVRMPYPQRRAQVPHLARLRMPMWRTGLLYGWQLGLNFVTYVRTPIIYLIVMAALLSGSVMTAILLILSLNLGRFLPLLINALPVQDWTVQRWLAVHEAHAIQTDASVLLFGGILLLILGLA